MWHIETVSKSWVKQHQFLHPSCQHYHYHPVLLSSSSSAYSFLFIIAIIIINVITILTIIFIIFIIIINHFQPIYVVCFFLPQRLFISLFYLMRKILLFVNFIFTCRKITMSDLNGNVTEIYQHLISNQFITISTNHL